MLHPLLNRFKDRVFPQCKDTRFFLIVTETFYSNNKNFPDINPGIKEGSVHEEAFIGQWD
jgi:hypothetical protein